MPEVSEPLLANTEEMQMSHDLAHHERQKFILSRDPAGHARYMTRRWWHGHSPKLIAILLLYLLASHWYFHDEAKLAEERAQEAAARVAQAERFKRADPVVFMIEARDPEELNTKLRAIRNLVNDQIVHSAAAQGK